MKENIIELMLVLAIIGFLISIAYPSYENHIQRTRRSDAMTALLDVQAQLERCYISTYSYETCANNLGLPHPSAHGFYELRLDQSEDLRYTLSAHAQGVQRQDVLCQVLSVDQWGQRMPSGHGCW